MSAIIELRLGEACVRVAPELGARITRCSLPDAKGRSLEVFHPYPEHHTDLLHWGKGGLYPLIPYWGRISNAQLQHGGAAIALCPHPDALPHTLHGTAHQSSWQVEHHQGTRLTLSLDKAPDAHWPWRYEARMSVTLGPRSLHVDIALTNADREPMPGGIGLHPYLRCAASARLKFAARQSWAMTPDFLGIRATPLDAPDASQRAPAVGSAGFTRAYGGWDGDLLLSDGDSAALRITASSALDHLILHRPDNAPYLCIEPVSHTADAFNLATQGIADTGALTLAPGQSLSATVGFSLE
ncbi:hypothetical protein WKW80_28560 [Variovorax humicola]|uniref:Aldose 1-epimerase n=1 Tax=Variovorax humicola TaxID=1769758 RepID=A0ABU8W979_9BURK